MIIFDDKCTHISTEFRSKVFDLLPRDFPSLILSIKAEKDGFNCLLRTTINNKADALEWKKTFEERSLTTYKVSKTFHESTEKLVFKKNFHCHRNSKPTSKTIKPSPKHSGCNSRLSITIKQPNMKRSRDQYLKKYPCVVDIYFVHNHPINDAKALKFRKPTQELEDIFSEYFANNHSPRSALAAYKIYLHNKHGDDYEKVIADGSKFPTYRWCWNLYYNIFKRQGVEPMSVKCLKKSGGDYNKFLCNENDAIHQEEPQEQEVEESQQQEVEELQEQEEAEEPYLMLQNDLKEIFYHLESKILNHREFQKPMRYFINCFKDFRNDSELISALNAFDKKNVE